MDAVRNVGFVDAIKLGFAKYANFRGRAQRSEYWWWILFYLIASVAAVILDLLAGTDNITNSASELEATGLFELLVSLALLIPTFAVTSRRLHDIDRSGWWQLLPLVAFVAFVLTPVAPTLAVILAFGGFLALTIVLIVWLVRDSDRGPNRFGPSPKYQGIVADDTVSI